MLLTLMLLFQMLCINEQMPEIWFKILNSKMLKFMSFCCFFADNDKFRGAMNWNMKSRFCM